MEGRGGKCLPAVVDRDKTTALPMDSKLRGEPYAPIPATKTPYSVQSGELEPNLLRDEKHATASFSPPPRKKDGPEREEERKSIWKRLSGSALCKVTVVVYLLGCVLVSALYVALYGGHSQKMFASSDAWIPGKVGLQHKTGTFLSVILCECVCVSVCVCVCMCVRAMGVGVY